MPTSAQDVLHINRHCSLFQPIPLLDITAPPTAVCSGSSITCVLCTLLVVTGKACHVCRTQATIVSATQAAGAGFPPSSASTAMAATELALLRDYWTQTSSDPAFLSSRVGTALYGGKRPMMVSSGSMAAGYAMVQLHLDKASHDKFDHNGMFSWHGSLTIQTANSLHNHHHT